MMAQCAGCAQISARSQEAELDGILLILKMRVKTDMFASTCRACFIPRYGQPFGSRIMGRGSCGTVHIRTEGASKKSGIFRAVCTDDGEI